MIDAACLGTVTGYPGVFQSNPCPYPSKPVPASMARVFVGTGRGFMKTHGFPNPCGFMPPEMTKEPRKSSASVNRHCRAALRGSEGRGNGNWGVEHAPQCECPVSCRGAVVVRGWLEWALLVAGRQLSLFVPVLCCYLWVQRMGAPHFSWVVVVCGWCSSSLVTQRPQRC
jgi:hypothetical protein